ncbi:glycosyl transferase family protein [Methylobacterium sp. GXF4]|uniref:glycosyltransferase n=1 Tax=Methylobacterium sp. GXF4 TaxID=1096546 RepID=UPI0002698F81|nr:glycosyltransferase [Methylobacterium sp. GXF4]EIZ86473.1 glycosyl transferase family protein [Methylobacterium sp. GXF4]
MAPRFTRGGARDLTELGRPLGRTIARSGVARLLGAGWRRGGGLLGDLDGLFHRWAGAPGTRASHNPLVRLAARGGLPRATDPTAEADQLALFAPHFDAAFYASWYGIGGEAALRDYLRTGWRQGRDPRPDFSTAEYLAARPFLQRADINPFVHYLRGLLDRGGVAIPPPDLRRATRLARRLVDAEYYLAGNPDLREAGVDPAGHYMSSGWREGREPSPHFDIPYYCLTRGISYAAENPLLHYVRHGGQACPLSEDEAVAFQVGTIAPYFDAGYYRGRDDDRSDEKLLRAYAAGEWRAMRSPRQEFDPAGFVQERADNRAVRRDPFFQYIAETLLSGGRPFEGPGRINFPAVDEEWYRATYSDMRGGVRPYTHFASTGWREGRDPGPRHSTLFTLLRVCGFRPERPPIEETGWIAEIGREPVDREAYLHLQAALAALHFDHAFYRRRYGVPDEVDAIRDYCERGWRTGRNPRADFNGQQYLDQHGSVQETGVAPFVHHLATAVMLGVDIAPGIFDPRYGTPPSEEDEALMDEALLMEPHFDADFYAKRYPDVAGARGGALAHFVAHGQHEGRLPNKRFSYEFYGRAYGHLLAAGESPFLHYVRTGRAAGLMACPEDLGTWPPMEAPEQGEWDGLPSGLPIARAEVVVIMPIYKGRGETLRAIHACLAAPQKTPFTLLAINDRSPDPDLTADLKDLAGRGLFHLVENRENLGFVRSVNRGLSMRQGRAVVLLNSDAEVFGDWLDRLVAHAETRPRVGSITPLSSNATICSYPKFNANNAMALEISRPELDQAAARINRGHAVEVPTGVGFCMYMTAAALDAVGALDEVAFGKGYGEENDWCMRARKAGFANLLAEDVYAYHAGQISFGLDPGGEYDQGQAALLAKHPDYPAVVGQFVAADPGRPARARLDLYRLARHFSGRAVLFVTHSWGGGIQRHIEDVIARLQGEGTSVVLLSVDRDRNLRINVSYRSGEYLYLPNLESLYLPRDAAEIAAFIAQLAPRLIHLHSLAGLRWSAARAMMDLVSGSGRPYAWTLHDFSPVCHRNHLVMPDGSYCGLAPVPVCRDCLASDAEGYEEPDPGERRGVFGRFLAGAARVFAPSADTAGRLREVYPDLAITVRPHFEADRRIRPATRKRGAGRRRVAVLGAINMMKGARFLQALATDARDRDLPIDFTIIGFSDPALRPALAAAGVTESGRYMSDDEALDLTARSFADLVLLPAIWPETYSYALTLALRTGLPVAAFDLGAQGERLRAYPQGHVLPYALLNDPAAFNDHLLSVDVAPRGRSRGPIQAAEYDDLMRDYYGLAPAP